MFWSNGLVGSITTLAFVLLFRPLLDRLLGILREALRSELVAPGTSRSRPHIESR